MSEQMAVPRHSVLLMKWRPEVSGALHSIAGQQIIQEISTYLKLLLRLNVYHDLGMYYGTKLSRFIAAVCWRSAACGCSWRAPLPTKSLRPIITFSIIPHADIDVAVVHDVATVPVRAHPSTHDFVG